MALLGLAARLVATLAFGLSLAWGHAAAQNPDLEYAVKANFLYKFGPFVTWPASVFEGPASPFRVCVAGQDPFGAQLDDAARGQAVDGHPVVILRLKEAAAALECQIVYLGRAPGRRTADALRLLHGRPVLSVTDARVGPETGIIHLMLRRGRVRFGVDAQAAQEGGLVISSKLLSLSTPVAGG